jgi:hypothetical protein
MPYAHAVMDIISAGFAYLAGMIGLTILMLIPAVFLHCIACLLSGIRIFFLLRISIADFPKGERCGALNRIITVLITDFP